MGTVVLPERYNASTTFIDANLDAGRGNKTAILYGDQALTYNDVAAMVNRTGNALIRLGVQMELTAKQWLKRMPSLARRSILGVWLTRLPYALIAWAAWSSLMM